MRFESMRVATALLGLGLSAALAQAPSKPAADAAVSVASAPGTVTVDAMDKLTGTVEAIDTAQRRITVKGPQGNLVTLSVGTELRNFNRIQVGDVVVVRYLAALSLTLHKNGQALPGASSATAAARAPAGDRPAGAVAQRVEITADVVAVDAASQRVSLRGPKQTVSIQVADPAQFKAIRVGDQVQAVYSEAVALSLEPAQGGK